MHHHHKNRSHDHATGAAVAGAIALSALAGGYLATRMTARRRRTFSGPEDAPAKTRRGHPAHGWREDMVVGRTVTIDRPRSELFSFWRDFSNLPKFMEHVESAKELENGRTRWIIKSPMGALEFETRITEEREGELIAWESDDDASVRNSGRVEFRDAPGGRGTQVDVTIAYDAAGGAAGRLIAKLFQKEPKLQARRELKRFKQLMETGEIATPEMHGEPPAPPAVAKAASMEASTQSTEPAKAKARPKAKSTTKQKT